MPVLRAVGRAGIAVVALSLLAVPPTVSAAPGPAGTLSLFAGRQDGAFPVEAPAEGWAVDSRLYSPSDLAVDGAGNLFVAEASSWRIYKINASGQLSFYAGNGHQGTPVPGPALDSPLGGNIAGIAVDAGHNVYFSDVGSRRVLKVSTGGTLSVVAGNGQAGEPVEGPATQTPLQSPHGLAFDSAGNLYVADTGANRILKVTPQGALTYFAGNGATPGGVQGPASSTQIDAPWDVAVDPSDNVYFSAPGADRVMKVTGGSISFFAGTGTRVDCGTFTPGPPASTQVCAPYGLATDPSGAVHIAAEQAGRVLKVSGGTVTVLAGDGTVTPTYGSPAAAHSVSRVTAVAIGNDGVGYSAAGSVQQGITRYSPATQTVPDPPTGVQVTAGNQKADLSWTVPTGDGGAALTHYRITFTPVPSGGGAVLTYDAWHGASGSTVYGLANDTRYHVQVFALNVIGASTPADGDQDVTPAVPLTAPGTPEALSVTPLNGALQLDFEPPASDGGSAIDHYEATLDAAANLRRLTTTDALAPRLRATVDGLANGSPYSVRVRAVNTRTGAGAWTAALTGTPRTTPGAPTGVSGQPLDGQALVRWTAPADDGGTAVTGYVVTATPQPVGTPITVEPVPASARQQTVSGLQDAVTYRVTVTAVNEAGIGDVSVAASVVMPARAALVAGVRLPTAIHIGGPWVPLSVAVTTDRPRTSVDVALFDRNGRRFAARTIAAAAPTTSLGGLVILSTADFPAWGAVTWQLIPRAPSVQATIGGSIRLHSTLGMAVDRAGDRVRIRGSARAYSAVQDTYLPRNREPVVVQRVAKEGWINVTTLRMDANGAVDAQLRIPWSVELRLRTADTPTTWGAVTPSLIR